MTETGTSKSMILLEQIKIMLSTNIPGNKDLVPLTYSMVYHPSMKGASGFKDMSEYPFITGDVDYKTKVKPYLMRQEFDDKINFFFNRESQLRILSTVGEYNPASPNFKQEVDSNSVERESAKKSKLEADKSRIEKIEREQAEKNKVKREEEKKIRDAKRNIEEENRELDRYIKSLNMEIKRNREKYGNIDFLDYWNSLLLKYITSILQFNTNIKLINIEKNNSEKNMEEMATLKEQIKTDLDNIKNILTIQKSLIDINVSEETDNREYYIFNISNSRHIGKAYKIIEKNTKLNTELEIEWNKSINSLFNQDKRRIDEPDNSNISTLITTIDDLTEKIKTNYTAINNSEKTIEETKNKYKGVLEEKNESSEKETSSETEEAIDHRTTVLNNLRHNISTMLQILFPTTFPLINNIHKSFNQKIKNNFSNFSFDNLWQIHDIYDDQTYSYLKLSGKSYTVIRIIWLNDIYNHPIYKKIVTEYRTFNVWKESKKGELALEVSKLEKKISSDFGEGGQYRITETERANILSQKKYNEKSQSSRYTNSDYEFERMNINIDKLIENIDELNTLINLKNPPYKIILDNAIAIKSLFEQLKQNKVIFKRDLSNKVGRLISSIEAINTAKTIKEKFIDNNELYLNYEREEDQNTQEELKKSYPQYSNFIQLFRQYIRPTRDTTNEGLQNLFQDFAKGSNSDELLHFLNPDEYFQQLVSAGRDEDGIKPRDKMNTGVGILPLTENQPKYEIYLQVDLIEGILNDKNISKINCLYKSEYLGTELDVLLYPQSKPWELNTKRLFFSLNDKEVQKEIKKIESKESKKEKREEESPVQGEEGPMKKQGGTNYRKPRKTRKFSKLSIYPLSCNNRFTLKR
jgi:hypothetical protein